MKNLIRYLYVFLLVFTLILTGINGVNVYSEDIKLLVTIGESFGSSDYDVSVPIDLTNLPSSGISAMNFVVEYDPNLILNDIRLGDIILKSLDFSYYVRENKVHILFSDSTGGTNPIKNDGTLCYLNFRTSGPNSKNEFSIRRVNSSNEIFVDNNLKKISTSFIDGKIINKDKIYGVSKYKIWKITFNQEIDPSSLRNGSVEVRDAKGVKIHSSFILTNGGKTLEIYPPDGGYEIRKSYTVTIKNSFLSKKGFRLSKEQNTNFYVEN